MVLTDKQVGVLKGMGTGLTITVISISLAIFGVLEPLLPAVNRDAAAMQALRWDALVVGCLAINIAMIARHRFFTPDDIDGGGLSAGTPTVHLLQSILQNTLEQTVLALGVHAVWASVMPQAWQAAVPIGSTLFVVGRILFWRGYARGAPSRALGFTLTFYPSAVMLLIIAGRLVLGSTSAT
jgi:MAPEG family